MTFKHKIKFILAVFKGEVNKVIEVKESLILKANLKETLTLKEFILERKKYLEKAYDSLNKKDREEVDKEYQQLEKVEKSFETWQKIKT